MAAYTHENVLGVHTYTIVVADSELVRGRTIFRSLDGVDEVKVIVTVQRQPTDELITVKVRS